MSFSGSMAMICLLSSGTPLACWSALGCLRQLVGRTDRAAITQWDHILTEMHLLHDPELKGVVQEIKRLGGRFDRFERVRGAGVFSLAGPGEGPLLSSLAGAGGPRRGGRRARLPRPPWGGWWADSLKTPSSVPWRKPAGARLPWRRSSESEEVLATHRPRASC